VSVDLYPDLISYSLFAIYLLIYILNTSNTSVQGN
jgi:hypothetical protein